MYVCVCVRAAAGTTGQTVAYPFDVARRRLQVSGWQGARNLHATNSGQAIVYTGMMDCFVRTVREEGFMALFKVGTLQRTHTHTHAPHMYLTCIPQRPALTVCRLVGCCFLLVGSGAKLCKGELLAHTHTHIHTHTHTHTDAHA